MNSDTRSNRSMNQSEMSGVAQNLQAFIQNIQSGSREECGPISLTLGRPKSQQQRQQTNEMPISKHIEEFYQRNIVGADGYFEEDDPYQENPIVHFPFKRANSTLDCGQELAVFPTSLPSERSGSTQRPNGGKQVRFDIKEGLINVMKAAEVTQATNSTMNVLTSEGDENNQNYINTLNGTMLYKQRIGTAKRFPPKVAQLKEQIRAESQSRSYSRGSQHTPEDGKCMNKPISCESNKSSDNQKPRKMHHFKTRQLALKYKRNADEMKKKKFGIEPPAPVSYCQDDTNYTSKLSNTKGNLEEESRETPSFSLAASKHDLHDLDQEPEEELQSKPEPQRIDNPLAIESPDDESYEDINHPSERTMPIEIEKSIGTIVKQQFKQTHDQNQNFDKPRDNSRNHQAGTIIRQRSTSPANSIQLTNLARKHQPQSPGVFIKVGQIVRNNSTAGLQSKDILLHQNFNQHPISYQHHEERPKDLRNYPSFSCIQPNESSRMTESSQMSMTVQTTHRQINYENHIYGTVWDLIKEDPKLARQKLQLFTNQNHQRKTAMLLVLSSSNVSPYYKLSELRNSLVTLVLENVSSLVEGILNVRERCTSKMSDLNISLRKQRQKPSSSNEALKSELLKDIIDRLTQKLTILMLRLNVTIKMEMRQQFEFYYRNYVASDIQRVVIYQMRLHTEKTFEKRQYFLSIKTELRNCKMNRILQAWKNRRIVKENIHQQLECAKEKLEHLFKAKILKHWRISLFDSRNKETSKILLKKWFYYKYRQVLFIKWVHALRQTNKIRRKALQIVGSNVKNMNIPNYRNDDQIYQASLQKIRTMFFQSINDSRSDYEQNANAMKKLLTQRQSKLSSVKLNMPFSPTLRTNRFTPNEGVTSRQNSASNRVFLNNNFDSQQPQANSILSQSMDLSLKYQIHQALVQSQYKIRANSGSREPLNRIATARDPTMHYISDGAKSQYENLRPTYAVNLASKHRFSSQEKVLSSRTHFKDMQFHVYNRARSPASVREQNMHPPNQLYKILADKAFQSNGYQRLQSQQPKLSKQYSYNSEMPLESQIKEQIKYLYADKQSLKNKSRKQHYLNALLSNAQDVVNKEDFKVDCSVTDTIQYGLASQNSRYMFAKMFQTRVQSTLFTKWRSQFKQRELNRLLIDLHTVNAAKQSFVEWHRALQQRRLWVKEFHRTKQLQRFYKIFLSWADTTRQQEYLDTKNIRFFRKKIVFTLWTRYLEKQGNILMKVLLSQSYYRQALISKGMLAFYQYHLKQIRINTFRKQHTFKKFFIGKWMKVFKKRKILKQLIKRRDFRIQNNERIKYKLEFENKQQAFNAWKQGIKEKDIMIKLFSAETHYRQQQVTKVFFYFKKLLKISQGTKTLRKLAIFRIIHPTFNILKGHSCELKKSEVNFKSSRKNYALTKYFVGWKSVTMQMKLAKLFFLKRIVRHWYHFVVMRNKILPIHYREKRLKALFLGTLINDHRAKWNEKRKDIIGRQLQFKRNERLMKVVFLKLLENLLKAKQRRMVKTTTHEFRFQNLTEKAFRAIKRRWLKRKKRRLMNQVAHDFNITLQQKKEDKLRESLKSSTHDFDIIRLRDLEVFEDPRKMMMYRSLNAWKMYIQDKLRRETVINRYLLFKRRMTSLRCFLGWRSIAKYEHSSGATTHKYEYSSAGSMIAPTTRGQSSQKHVRESSREMLHTNRKESHRMNSMRVEEARSFLFDPRVNLMNNIDLESVQSRTSHHGASATFGQRSLASNEATPQHAGMNTVSKQGGIVCDTPSDFLHGRNSRHQHLQASSSGGNNNQFAGTSSLFNELEGIFQKNRKWLDEQREREEFLREMANQYNTRLSQEMSTLRYSQDHMQYPSLTMSLISAKK